VIAGVGIDIVEISRIRAAVTRWKEAFLKRIFTENEISYSHTKKFAYQHLAARFAAKEAVLKAIGDSSIQRIEWHEVEVFNDEFGRPYIRLSGEAKKIKDNKGISEIIISMSHTRTFAVANAILIKDGRD
jgi:holo-[acyl-carrier protein] synthase